MRDLILRRAATRLARRLTGLRHDGGRGAIGVLVAIMIGAGVLFGMGALVIDVGQVFENRAELQNGADAASLAVAKSCARGTCDPSTATATTYAAGNASKLTGGKANVNFVCGVNGTTTLGSVTCPVKKGVCPQNPPAGTNWVDVETSTLLPNGSTLLPPVFAGTLAGTHSGSTVYACAQAEWGAPLSSTTIGFTISACTWDEATGVADPKTGQATGNPPVLASPPPPLYNMTNPPVSLQALDQVVYAKGGPNQKVCATEQSGAAPPGNFGWTSKSNCSVLINAGIYPGSTGNTGAGDCQPLLAGWRANQTVLEVPVYTSAANPGNNATFTLKGFAAFVVTGYSLPSFNANDWVTGKAPCNGGAWCISGFFVHDLVSTSGSLGGVDLGADIIKLTG
jgi:Flp pilus assembly protein TadG